MDSDNWKIIGSYYINLYSSRYTWCVSVVRVDSPKITLAYLKAYTDYEEATKIYNELIMEITITGTLATPKYKLI